MNKRQRKKQAKKWAPILKAVGESTYPLWQSTAGDNLIRHSIPLDEAQSAIDEFYKKGVENVELAGGCIFVSTP